MPSIGSAYVLFYQSVEMQTQALGLPEPPQPPQYTSIPQRDLDQVISTQVEEGRAAVADAPEKEGGRNWFGLKKDRRQASTASNTPTKLGLDVPSLGRSRAGTNASYVEAGDEAASVATQGSSQSGAENRLRERSRERATGAASAGPSSVGVTPNISRVPTSDSRVHGSTSFGHDLTTAISPSPSGLTKMLSRKEKNGRPGTAESGGGHVRKPSLASKFGFGKKS